MRIDTHIHFTPPAMAEDLASFSAQEPYWGLLLNPVPGQRSIQGWATPERMISDMDRAGIDRVVILGEYRLRHETSVERNDQALDILRRWPDRVSAFACIQPKAGEKALSELKRCLDGGMCGVGESNPYGQGHTFADPDFLRLVEACIDYDIPLNLHVSEEVGHYYPGKSTTSLRHYYELARRYPELKLILAHWGGGLFLYELMPEVRVDLHNVWYDTAASPLLYPTPDIFDVALRCVDHRKVLFGSDYPLLIVPREQTEPGFELFLRQIDALGLDPAVYDDILGNNAARLFGWLPEDSLSPPVVQTSDRPTLPPPVERIEGSLPVLLVARTWPETTRIFERFGIPCEDSPVPEWEPVVQAAAARGFGPDRQRLLLDALNEVAGLNDDHR